MKGIGFVRLLSIGKEGITLNSDWELQMRETIWSMDQDQNFTAMFILIPPQEEFIQEKPQPSKSKEK